MFEENSRISRFSIEFRISLVSFFNWDDPVELGESYIKQLFRHRAVRKEFEIIHGCKNYRNPKYNPSRIKSNWLKNLI